MKSLAAVFLGCTILIQLSVPCHSSDSDAKFEYDLDMAMKTAEDKVHKMEEYDELMFKKGIDKHDHGSPYDLLIRVLKPTEKTTQYAKNAYVALDAIKEMKKDKTDANKLKGSKKYIRIWKRKFRRYCFKRPSGEQCPQAIYRSPDGTCNNLKFPKWGAAGEAQRRLLPPVYVDGIDEPLLTGRDGKPLKSPREISNNVFKACCIGPRNKEITQLLMQYGQFLDHDITLSPVLQGVNGTNIECCVSGTYDRAQCLPIYVSANDPFYKQFGTRCINFVRSAPAVNDACSPGYRNIVNQITPFIDGSSIYGSSQEEMNKLRSFVKGKLKTSKNDFLPHGDDHSCVRDKMSPNPCFLSGDERVSEQPALALSHTIFMREHNRIAMKLAKLNPDWSDETLFQETRRILGAMMQIITYDEFLPCVLGKRIMKKYKLDLRKPYRYNPRRNPAIIVAFSTACYRFGHSLIPSFLGGVNKKGKGTFLTALETHFFRTKLLFEEFDEIARWLYHSDSPEADGRVKDSARNHLFQNDKGEGLDLPAFNINRGRDHGLAPYNAWRRFCRLRKGKMKYGKFDLPDHTQEETDRLQKAYRHPDDIELFPGGLTEIPVPGGLVGPTFACLLGIQFSNLKAGDRFWFQTRSHLLKFTQPQMRELRKVTLARVLCNNVHVGKIQPNVFKQPGKGNERVDCSEIPAMDLGAWKATGEPYENGKPRFDEDYGRR